MLAEINCTHIDSWSDSIYFFSFFFFQIFTFFVQPLFRYYPYKRNEVLLQYLQRHKQQTAFFWTRWRWYPLWLDELDVQIYWRFKFELACISWAFHPEKPDNMHRSMRGIYALSNGGRGQQIRPTGCNKYLRQVRWKSTRCCASHSYIFRGWRWWSSLNFDLIRLSIRPNLT